MGEDVVIDYPEIDPLKYYCVHTIQFEKVGVGCTDNVTGQNSCCITGVRLLAYLDVDGWLLENSGFCFGPVMACELIIDFDGPYDLEADCLVGCP